MLTHSCVNDYLNTICVAIKILLKFPLCTYQCQARGGGGGKGGVFDIF